MRVSPMVQSTTHFTSEIMWGRLGATLDFSVMKRCPSSSCLIEARIFRRMMRVHHRVIIWAMWEETRRKLQNRQLKRWNTQDKIEASVTFSFILRLTPSSTVLLKNQICWVIRVIVQLALVSFKPSICFREGLYPSAKKDLKNEPNFRN